MKKANIERSFCILQLLTTLVFLTFVGIPVSGGQSEREYNGAYSGEYLNHIAFPLGGIGAGMICLEGAGAISHVSVYNKPDMFNEPCTFAALCIKSRDNIAKVLEGPVPSRKLFGQPGGGNGSAGKTYGLPRFEKATFLARFPFAHIRLEDNEVPMDVEILGWSPFIPCDADNSSLPLAALEYSFKNTTNEKLEAVFSFNSKNFMAVRPERAAVSKIENGFILEGSIHPRIKGEFAVFTDDTSAKVNRAWFRGFLWDALTMAWNDVQRGNCYDKPPVSSGPPGTGGTVFIPFELSPGAEKKLRIMLCWYVPNSDLRFGPNLESRRRRENVKDLEKHQPWYAGRFSNIRMVADHWRDNYQNLRSESKKFSDCFYDSTLPAEVIETIAANLTILKSPTVLRQTDGRLWCFEGCRDNRGCCYGSCTHVWNYAQALPHLFAKLERSLRKTEFNESQDHRGHQMFRSSLPVRPTTHRGHAAADGQLGGIMKVYRDWRISGDTDWLKRIWHKVKKSLDYCIKTWDPQHNGVLSEPHHNTYDIEFWGPDAMCTSFYLGALNAACKMAKAVNEDCSLYRSLLRKGRKYTNNNLFNGEYYYQKVQWKELEAESPLENKHITGRSYLPEVVELFKKEGPRHQYGNGCLSDGVLGSWMARVCGLYDVLDEEKVESHLKSVYKYNLKSDLFDHANPQRPGFAAGHEGGLLLCTWPRGDKPSLPFVYSDEVWTGIEYQVASHLIMHGMIEEGLDVVRKCRDRYDGRVRNPFNEYECGNWYARAMSSYALLQALTGARYDAVQKILYLEPRLKGDFRSFLCTATGYLTVGVKDGKPFYEVTNGSVQIDLMEYKPNEKSAHTTYRLQSP